MNQGALIEEPIFNETSGYVAMMSGFVIAPYTGDFEFYVAASDKVALFISNTTNANNASLISSSSGPISPNTYGEKSMAMFLEGNSLMRNNDFFLHRTCWRSEEIKRIFTIYHFLQKIGKEMCFFFCNVK